MLNILGQNITEDKGCGFIADGEYNRFVDVMLKAQKVVDRLQCKEMTVIFYSLSNVIKVTPPMNTHITIVEIYNVRNTIMKFILTIALIAKTGLSTPEKVKGVRC